MSDDPRPSANEEQVPEDEWVPTDDAVIGRAFRRSMIAIVALAVVALAVFLLTRTKPPVEEVKAKEVGPIRDLLSPAETIPTVRFHDVTRESGIDFVHVNGARGQKLLPETMGGGVAFLDADGDADPDLVFVSSAYWPDDRRKSPPALALYLNDGKGKFRKSGSVTDEAYYGLGTAVGDFDNDGDPDLFVTALGPNHLYRNDGGRFVDVTAKAGVAGGRDTWSSSAGFFDYDNDGDLDLFVCNYIRWSKEIDLNLNFTLNGKDRAYGPPTNYEGAHPYLYRNDGNGTFTDVSSEAGIQILNPATGQPVGKGLAVTFADIDRDGYLDVLVANDTVQNFLFRNLKDGTFEEVGAASGFGFDTAGKATGAMGIDASHYRNDEELAVGIGNFANEMTSLYVAQGGGFQFTDEAAGEGIGSPSRTFLTFGLFFFDYDLDGRLDLLQTNGHLETEISQVQASQRYRQPAQLFWNAGPDARSCFAEVPQDSTGDLSAPIVGRGAAFADVDGDGDEDVVLTQTGGPPLFLRNDQELGNHWLRVGLSGERANREGIGARVEVEAGGGVLRRTIMPTRSYLSQVEPKATFGLGGADRVDRVRVFWPGGSVQEMVPEGIDREIVIRQES